MLSQEKFKQHVQFLLHSSFDPEHIRAVLEYAEDYTNLLVQTNAELLGSNVELTLTNTQLTTDYANALAGQNTQLANQVNTAHATFCAVRNLDAIQINELQDRLERALDSEEQTAQQNNILLSQMSALKNQPTILNPINWGKGQWYSFAIGVAVGEQAIEQFTDYKPIRRLVSRGAKKLFGKTGSAKMRVPETMKPTMSSIEQFNTHIGVSPVPTVPVVQVHN